MQGVNGQRQMENECKTIKCEWSGKKKILAIVSVSLILILTLTVTVLYFTVGSRLNSHYFKKVQSQNFLAFDKSKVMTEAEVKADRDELIRNVENTHPYFAIKEVVGYEAAKQQLMNAEIKNATDFYFAASEYLAVFNDLHTGVSFGFSDFALTGLNNYIENDKLMLYPYGQFNEAYELVAINGVGIKQIIASYSSLENANTISFGYSGLIFSVEYLQRAGIEIGNFLTFTYKKADGELFDITHPITIYSTAANASSTKMRTNLNINAVAITSDNFSAEIKNDEVLYIRARAMQDDGSYQACLGFIKDAVKNGIKKVVIDVTDNGGGSDGYGTGILTALGFKFSRMGFIVRYSDVTAEYGGTWFRSGHKALQRFKYISNNTNNIQLKVFCNERTGSAAMAVVSACRYSDLGELIGRMPGQNSNFCGNIVYLQLAHSKIIYVLPMTYSYYEIHGQKTSGEVIPDIFVPALENYMNYVVWR